MKRIDVWATLIKLTRAADLEWLSGGTRPSVTFLVTALDNVNRIARTLERMHTDECNGDHEKCQTCKGEGKGYKGFPCNACHGWGRRTEREIDAWYRKRDTLEARAVAILKSAGLVGEIERDPRGGPVRVFASEADRSRGDMPIIVLPMGGAK